MNQFLKRIVAATAIVMALASPTMAAEENAADVQAVRALFLRQAAGATAHDIHEMEAVFASAAAGQPDPVSFIARAYRYWGRDEVIAHFRRTFAGTWRFEPDETAIKVSMLGKDVAQIYAPTRVTVGPAGQPPTVAQFHMTEFALRTPDGWRIATIVAVPAQ